jgi:prevent-host-death family protein
MIAGERPREVTATELQKDYARVIRDAEYGHPTTVTRSGKPVAKVVPPDTPANQPTDAQWAAAREKFRQATSDPTQHRQAIIALGDLLNTHYHGHKERA